MWEWITGNGFGILIWSIVALITFVVLLNRVQDRIEREKEKSKAEKRYMKIRNAMRVLIGICLGIITLAAVAVVNSEQGVEGMITSETIEIWFMEHGAYILAILAVSYVLYRVAKLLMPRVAQKWVHIRGKGRQAREERDKRGATVSSVMVRWITILIVVVAVMMILAEIGVNIVPLMAGAGIAGVAFGFGAQGVVKDMLRGLFIISQNQYNKGDVVRVAGITGLVEDVSMWRTIMRDLDGIVHTIPNGEITTSSNYTKEWSRVNLNISVAYGEDLDHVIAVLNRVGAELAQDNTFGPMIIGTPRVLRVDNFGDSGIEIKVLGETKPLKQWDVMGELRKRIKKAFDEEDIEIPWPHIKLYYGNAKSSRREV